MFDAPSICGTSQTDARGNSTGTVTDADKGTVTQVTDPLGRTVTYTYDALKRVTQTSASLTSTSSKKTQTVYGPDDRLQEVKHNTTTETCDVSYTFTYDEAGRQKKVSVAGQALSETFYNPDGTVEKTVYGNSTVQSPQQVKYRYDGFKRLIGVRYDGDMEDRITYDYDASGRTARAVDHVLGRTVQTEYDSADRPVRTVRTEGNTHLYTGKLTYDEKGRADECEEKVGAGTAHSYKTSFTYDREDRVTELSYGLTGENKVTYTYDGIGRITERKVVYSGHTYTTGYSYLTGQNGLTTPLVSGISQSGESLVYTYDACGNITQVKTGTLITKYTYDKIGRLTRVNDQTDLTADSAGTTWVFTYDLGGNIKTKKAYAYTTGSVSGLTPAESHTYTYGSAGWKDKLTKFDGTTIAYDQIGNPTSDGTWSYTWEHGKQLRQMSKTGETVRFEYNEDGLRTKKTATSTGITEYTLHGKNIVHMTQGGHELHFYGNKVIVKRNGIEVFPDAAGIYH